MGNLYDVSHTLETVTVRHRRGGSVHRQGLTRPIRLGSVQAKDRRD